MTKPNAKAQPSKSKDMGTEPNLRLLFERSPDAILLLDGEKFIDCNPAAVKMLRAASKEQVLDLHPSQLSPERQPDGSHSDIKADEMIQAAFEQGNWRFEWVHRRVDGEEFPVEVTLTAVPWSGRQILYTEWRDISDHKQAEEALRAVFNSVHDAIFLHELDGTVIDVNDKMLEMYGVNKEQALALSIAEDFSSPDNPLEQLPHYWENVVAGQDQLFEWKARRPNDGSVFEAEVFLTKLRLREREVILATVSDISPQKELENQIRESLRRRGQQVEISTEVAQEIAVTPRLSELFRQVVELVQERFGYYHAHVYALEQETLVMQEGTGEAGQQMKADGHSIDLAAEQSLVAQAARSGRPVLVPDVTQEPGWLPNPLLPETRAEIAVPIKLGEQVLGVLDVQNDAVSSLSEEDQLLLLGLCGQIAVAMEQRRTEAEQQRLTTELESKQSTLRAILENIPLGVYVAEVPSGKPLLTNQRAEEMLGRGISAGAGPEELAEVYEAYRQGSEDLYPQMEMPLVRGMGGEITAVDDMEIRRPDGSSVMLQVFGAPIVDASGKIMASVAIFQDITQRKQSDELLAKRASELETVAELSAQMASVLDPGQLLQTVVDLTKEGFELYHAHIYLLNEVKDTLNLAAGAGEVGRQMVAEGWNIPVEREHSLVARAARSGQGVISNDVRQEPDFLPNPLLPDTRAEMAIPIIVEAQVIGVLDVQADIPDRFTDEDVRIKTTLASQVAVALQNARLFRRSEEAFAELNALTRRLTREGWEEYFQAQKEAELGYVYDLQQILPVGSNTPVEPDESNRKLTQPLQIRGETIGQLELAEPKSFVDEAADIVDAVAERLAAHLENLRLTEQTEQRAAELTEATNFMDSIIENLPTMLFVKDAEELRFVRWNRAGEELVGYSREDMLGKNDYDFFPKEEADFFTANDRQVLANGQMVEIPEEPIETLHQGTRFLHTRKIPIFGPDGKPKYLLGLSEDITEQRQAQEALRESQAQLSEALDIARLGYWEFDVESQMFTFNDQIYALYHTTVEQEGGYQMTAADFAQRFVHPEEAASVGTEIAKAMETTDPDYTANFVNRINCADGEQIYVAVQIRIVKDEQGRTVRMYGTNQDITERMTTEAERERLLAEVQRLAAIVENHPDFIGIGSLEGEALYINPAGLNMVGLPLDQDVGQIDFMQFNPPDEVEQFIKEAIPTAFEAGSWTGEGTLLRVDGTSLAVEKTVAVNYGADKKPISLSITMRDVAERKRAEAERERLLAEVEAAYRQYVRQEWDQFLGEQHQGQWRIEHQQAGLPEALSGNGKTGAALEVPVSLRGQPIGIVSLEDTAPDRTWTAEEKALVETVTQQLALTIENLRLFEDTQQQATREQLTRQITDKMRSAPDAESIIQIGVQELAKVFQSSHLVVELDMNSNDNEILAGQD